MSTPAVTSSTSFSTGWQKLYSTAILEIDNSKLRQRILDARQAIYDRAEEILTASAIEERRSLNYALRTLRVLEEIAQKKQTAA